MPYNIENIFICLAAPFLLAALGTNLRLGAGGRCGGYMPVAAAQRQRR